MIQNKINVRNAVQLRWWFAAQMGQGEREKISCRNICVQEILQLETMKHWALKITIFQYFGIFLALLVREVGRLYPNPNEFENGIQELNADMDHPELVKGKSSGEYPNRKNMPSIHIH